MWIEKKSPQNLLCFNIKLHLAIPFVETGGGKDNERLIYSWFSARPDDSTSAPLEVHVVMLVVPFLSILHSQYVLNPNHLSPTRRKTDWYTEENAADAGRCREASVLDSQQRGARRCSLTECIHPTDGLQWLPQLFAFLFCWKIYFSALT